MFNLPSNFRFPTFDWLNKGAFLWGGLGLAAAYAFGLVTPFMAQSWTFVFALVSAAIALAVLLPGRTVRPVQLSLVMLLALVFTLVLPAPAAAADCSRAKSFADPCWNEGQGQVIIGSGYKRVGKSNIYIIGKALGGKYNVYDLQADDTGFYIKDSTKYATMDVLRLLDSVDEADVGKTLNCDFGVVCKTRQGEVVGVHPFFKAKAGLSKKQ
jgi:hypothetical protein